MSSNTNGENIAFSLALIIQCDDKLVELQNVTIVDINAQLKALTYKITELELRCTNLEK